MLPKKIEDIVKPVVEKFVAERNGFYRKHCSDILLTSLIVFQLGLPSRRDENKTVAEVIIKGDQNEAYGAVCWLFESILEGNCCAGGNGHHVAQKFAAAMDVLRCNIDVGRENDSD